MRRGLAALVAGLLFGLGLAVSRMVDPAKVLGFLDVAGDWDPSLAFVMGGALLVTLPAYRIALRFPQPALAPVFHLPTSNAIDAKLLAGAALFGTGWGLVGFCPGPALAALSLGDGRVVVFVAAMLAGMAAHTLLPQAPRGLASSTAR